MPLYPPPPTGGGGGGGMAIGGAVSGGTPGSVLYVDSSSNLGQDNANFNWTDSTHILKLEGPPSIQLYNVDDHAGNFERASLTWNGISNVFEIGTMSGGVGGTGVLRESYYYTAGRPGLFRVPNGSGDNWFEDNAGNFGVTGYLNFGTGDNCLASLSSGTRNTGYGNGALFSCTTGFDNFGIGYNACSSVTSGDSNVAVGTFVMQLGPTLSNNVGLGFATLRQLGSAGGSPVGNVGLGAQALNQLRSGNSNVAIGYTAAQNIHDGPAGVYIGNSVLNSATGTNQYNTMVGNGAGFYVSNANACTILGSWFGPSAALNNIIAITDGSNPTNPQVDWGYTHANVWTFQYPVCVVPSTVGALPAAGVQGRRAFVSDATSTTFAAIAAGGGANPVPVYDDGTNWRIG